VSLHVASSDYQKDAEETVKMPAIAKGHTDVPPVHSDVPGTEHDTADRGHGVSTPMAGHARLEQIGATNDAIPVHPDTVRVPAHRPVHPAEYDGVAQGHGVVEQTIATEGLPAQASSTISPGGGKPGARSVIPKRTRAKKPVILELTLQGMQVKSWYEEVRGSKLRMTSGNVNACNALGECEECSLDSLKAVIEHLDGLTWVKEHDFAIDIQVLAKDDSRLNFEKNWPLVKRKQNGKAKSHADQYGNDYSLTGMLARQQKAM